MYPIIVFPKPKWEDADNDTIANSIKATMNILGYCAGQECDGRLLAYEPSQERTEDGETKRKFQCNKCGAVIWQPI
jgi:DNA-directed RNA polymerase subunit M/transcription elongation factor TFIIS